jgi:hypothetical protein
MHVDVSCKKCGRRQRMDIGAPASGSIEDDLHLLKERLAHQPSFECFGGHFEFSPPLPHFWQIHWETLESEQ